MVGNSMISISSCEPDGSSQVASKSNMAKWVNFVLEVSAACAIDAAVCFRRAVNQFGVDVRVDPLNHGRGVTFVIF